VPCRAVPCQLGALTAYLQGLAVLEGDLRFRPGRVIVQQQPPPRLPDADHVRVEQRGRTGVVGAVVRVDEVGHRVAYAVGSGDLVHGPPQVWPMDGCVEQRDAVPGGQERRLVGAIGDSAEVPHDTSDVVPLIVEG